MTLLLDTNVVVSLLRGRPAAVRDRLRQARRSGQPVVVSSLVVFELWYGIPRSRRPSDNAELLRVFLSGEVDVVPFEQGDARVAGELRAVLAAKGTPIGPYDLLIAGQALHREATVVTANAREFARVPGLRWEDWTTQGPR